MKKRDILYSFIFFFGTKCSEKKKNEKEPKEKIEPKKILKKTKHEKILILTKKKFFCGHEKKVPFRSSRLNETSKIIWTFLSNMRMSDETKNKTQKSSTKSIHSHFSESPKFQYQLV